MLFHLMPASGGVDASHLGDAGKIMVVVSCAFSQRGDADNAKAVSGVCFTCPLEAVK